MPASAESVRATDAYRLRMVEVRRRVALAAGAFWQLDAAELELGFSLWLDRVTLLLTAAQETLAQLSDAYVAAFVAAELSEPYEPVGVDPAAYAGKTIDERPVGDVLAPALFTVKRFLAAGKTFDEASAAGRARALRNVEVEASGAARGALDEAIEREPRVKGWRRVTSRRPCGACLASASGVVHKPRERLSSHPHCSCTKEPVVDGVRETIRRPTGRELFDRMAPAQQDGLFAGRGGKDKAELVRSGAVDLDDLVSHERQVLDGRPAIITETPLARLG